MVHQYINNGYHIVLDVNSGSVHVVDELVYSVIKELQKQESDGQIADFTEKKDEILKTLLEDLKKNTEVFQTYREQEIEEAVEEVTELVEAEMLFTKDIYEGYIKDFKKRKTVVKALCLHIAHDCNLACKYCFAEEGEYHGRRAFMSYEVGKAALDFLVANSGNRINLEVDFFGGEPLMNFQVVKDLVAYGRSLEAEHHKKFRFTLTTNGVLLNDDIM